MTDRRRFLVVVRAGDASLHPGWVDAGRPRTFDLVVSYYGEDPGRYRDGEFARIDDAGQKFHGLKRLFLRDGFWRDYERIWLPDDDLATEQDQIDALFAASDAAALDLSQPALEWHSHYSFDITLRSPSFALRYTDLVEVMAPCFSRAFLERALATFDENQSGWGLSFVWPRLAVDRPRNVAIVDAANVTHTRPVGGPAYDRLRALGIDASSERRDLMLKYGLSPHTTPRVLAAIDADGRGLDPAWPADGGRLARKLARDALAFRTARERIGAASLGRRPAVRAAAGIDPGALRDAAARLRASA